MRCCGPDGFADPADTLFQDWFELYNPNTNAIDLSGYYLTDTLLEPDKWLIPANKELAVLVNLAITTALFIATAVVATYVVPARTIFGSSSSKSDDSDWHQLKPAVLAAIMEHFTAGRPVILADAAASADTAESGEEEDEIVTQIKELLETRVRPAVAMDGGDIIFDDFADGIVYLHMQGSCSGCPSSTATLKAGIENMLRHYIPEVIEVRAV